MVEVLAPAGNIEALKSAVFNCADAVYLGLEQFNARLKADNFSTHNIAEWVDFCHLYGVKVYVTLNTSIKQQELSVLEEMLTAIENANVDALIVTDLAVVPLAKKYCPTVELHASTQLGVHNRLGAKLLEELGFSRVVLARECKIEDIKDIKNNTNLQIEYFVHGALCVSFSGQCLLSSISTGNSGNRGLCLQPCRKFYTEDLTNSSGYLISPKDQCLIDNLQELIDAGVDSLKIEGRLKSSEYVGVTVEKYKKAVNGLKLTEQDYSELKRVFNRGGFSKGYSFSAKNQILYTKTQNHIGENIGEVLSCTKGKDYFKLEVVLKDKISNGDGLKIFRDNQEVGGFEASIIEQKGNKYKLFSKKPYQKGDKVNITFDSKLKNKFCEQERKIALSLKCKVQSNCINFESECNGNNLFFAYNTNLQLATNVATSVEEIKTQLAKTGNTPIVFSCIDVEKDDEFFIPKSVLNQARRECVNSFIQQISFANTNRYTIKNYGKKLLNRENNFDVSLLKSEKCKDILILKNINEVEYFSQFAYNIIINYADFDKSIINYAINHNNLYVKLPKIAMKQDLDKIETFVKTLPNTVGIYADNLYAYYLAYKQERNVIGGLGLNIYNNSSQGVLGLKNFVASAELSKNEIESMNTPCAVYSLGYLPLMNFCHCPIQHFTDCSCGDCKYKEYSMKDQFGSYKIRRTKIVNCYFEMLNSNLYFIEKEMLPQNCFAMLDLSNIEENAIEVVNNYFNNSCFINNNGVKLTRGLFMRGAK